LRILAVVLARGGSKRVPGKNLRLLGGKSLIVRSIEVVQGIPEVCAVLTSTDDRQIARIAADAGSLVPWLRPADLASDTASSLDACLHALDWYQQETGSVDGLMLLQPTSPFRTRDSVLRGIELFGRRGAGPIVGVSPARTHPFWCFRIADGMLRPFIADADLHVRSQDLPPAYAINGAFYLARTDKLRHLRSFFCDDMVPLVMTEREGIDIDSEIDLRIAEAMIGAEDSIE
jgi:CMP-N,N'-diacetyllegionaminic acid synthase